LHTERLVLSIMSDTREYIIDEAFKLFISSSYEAVSISDISTAIGFTKGALYHHFKNKEDLFRAVIDKHFFVREIEVDVDNVTLLQYNELCISHVKKIFEKLFPHSSTFVPVDYLSLIADCFRHYKGFSDEKICLMDTEIDKIKRILDKAVERREIRNDINTIVIARSYFSIQMGLAGNFIKNDTTEKTIQMLRDQLSEMYKLLKI